MYATSSTNRTTRGLITGMAAVAQLSDASVQLNSTVTEFTLPRCVQESPRLTLESCTTTALGIENTDTASETTAKATVRCVVTTTLQA